MRQLTARPRRRLPARVRDEHGFTMLVVLGVLLVVMGLSVAAFGAVNGDLASGRNNQDQKQAYAAAEAGLNEYFYHLTQNPDYWTMCTGVPAGDVVQARSSPTGHWRAVTAGASSQYVIELLPANGASSCQAGTQANATMIDATTATFRIRVTGKSRNVTRSIVASFRRRGFLDYLYFTDFEDLDPSLSGDPPACGTTHYRFGRSGCREIQFAPGDVVSGPLHTNDQMLICGQPKFGRNSQDNIEASDVGPPLTPSGTKPPGWRGSNGCSGNQPNFTGTFVPGALALNLPQSNGTLLSATSPNYRFSGKTTIVLNADNTMMVTNAALGPNPKPMLQPDNGLIYVANGQPTCGQTYSLTNPYPPNEPAGCADLWLKGSFSKPLTINSDKDIIVNGDLLSSNGTGLLGLIAQNFVRVWHPTATGGNGCANAYPPGTGPVHEIDAASLSLTHSFIVDNYFCGAPLGTLTVTGAIAQKFRGAVGTGNGNSVATGYLKNYTYDDRLRYRTPPSFLDPVQTAWRIQRYTEQVPPGY